MRAGLIGLGVTLSLGLFASTLWVGRVIVAVKSQHQSLEVKGFAERRIESDWTTWSGSFTTRAATLEAAHSELAAQREKVLSLVAELGFDEAELELRPARTHALYRRDVKGRMTHEIEAYALSLELAVASAALDRVEELARAAAGLASEGIEFDSARPQYFYRQLDSLKVDMLGEATADARRRAEVLAREGGSGVGALRYARQGVFQITPAHSTEVSDYGNNDTSARQKSIKAVVTVRYAIDG